MKNGDTLARLVMIEWADSRQPTASWQRLRDAAAIGYCKCCSVGFLLRDDAEVKVLAANMGDDDDDMQATGVIVIPAVAVLAIKPLVEATSVSLPSGSKRNRRRT
jgi:hypothetical protein